MIFVMKRSDLELQFCRKQGRESQGRKDVVHEILILNQKALLIVRGENCRVGEDLRGHDEKDDNLVGCHQVLESANVKNNATNFRRFDSN
jgi:hypothetical protein